MKMDEISGILDRFTDSTTGSLHGAIFVVVDSSGTIACLKLAREQLSRHALSCR